MTAGSGPSSAITTTLLTARLAAILDPLDPLGGRSALAAHHIPAPARTARAGRTPSGAARGGKRAETPPAASEERVAIRADEVFPAASLAKLCIAVELCRRADLGQFDLDERFDTSDEPRAGGGGVLDYLDPTVRLTLGDLLFLMLGVSDNTAANFLLDLVGMGEVNETMSRLALAHTRLARRFMDFAARAAHRDNLTSAGDMAALLALVRGSALPGAARLREMLAAQRLGEDIAEWLPPEAQLAHKTGTLEDVFHDAGILTGPGGACVYCVLTAEQPHLPSARAAVGRAVRTLWDAWCAPAEAGA
jgi:beta-lactamase class A